jgi:hypothetical protein
MAYEKNKKDKKGFACFHEICHSLLAMRPHTTRSKDFNFYHAKNFSLIVAKNKSPYNILTFDLSGEFTSLIVDRHESMNALKKFKKVLAKSRQPA